MSKSGDKRTKQIHINDACDKALHYLGYPCISSIVQIENGLIIVPCNEAGEIPYISPVIVTNDGKVGVYFPPDHHDEIICDVDVPDKYKPWKI